MTKLPIHSPKWFSNTALCLVFVIGTYGLSAPKNTYKKGKGTLPKNSVNTRQSTTDSLPISSSIVTNVPPSVLPFVNRSQPVPNAREHPELWPQRPIAEEDWLVAPPDAVAKGKDPLAYVTQNPAFKGRIFYLPYTGEAGYLAFRGVNQHGELEEEETTITSSAAFYFHSDVTLFRPKFLPGGQHVSFVQGYSNDSNSLDTTYFWNFKKRTYVPLFLSYYYRTETFPDLKYTANIEGCDRQGDAVFGHTFAELWIRNNEKGGRRQVDEDDPRVPDKNFSVIRFCWTNQSTLLYVKFPLDTRPSFQESGIYRPPYHPSIYEVLPETMEAFSSKATLSKKTSISKKKLIGNGFAPEPSPDGRWIAYFGWPPLTPEQEKQAKTSRTLVKAVVLLFDRQNSKIYKLRSTLPAGVIWSHDS